MIRKDTCVIILSFPQLLTLQLLCRYTCSCIHVYARHSQQPSARVHVYSSIHTFTHARTCTRNHTNRMTMSNSSIGFESCKKHAIPAGSIHINTCTQTYIHKCKNSHSEEGRLLPSLCASWGLANGACREPFRLFCVCWGPLSGLHWLLIGSVSEWIGTGMRTCEYKNHTVCMYVCMYTIHVWVYGAAACFVYVCLCVCTFVIHACVCINTIFMM
jgi:hypothetical protein